MFMAGRLVTGRLRLPPQAARTEGPPRTRPGRWINRAKRTTRRGRITVLSAVSAAGRV